MGMRKQDRKDTIPVRAPKDIIEELRENFPDMNDSSRISLLYKTSPVKAEAKIRDFWRLPENENTKKREDNKLDIDFEDEAGDLIE